MSFDFVWFVSQYKYLNSFIFVWEATQDQCYFIIVFINILSFLYVFILILLEVFSNFMLFYHLSINTL